MMRGSAKFGAFASVALVLSLYGGARAADLKIAAAANLQKALTESLIPAFEKQSGATVTPTFGSTKLLAKQLENGAPEDVFVSADTATVAKLVSEGQLDGATQKVYAIGRLAIWTRKDARLHPRRIQDLENPAYVRIAIANPRLAPYGLAAQQSLEAAGLTASVMPRLAVAENIAQALQYARSGNADVSLTALALVIDDRDDPYVIVPDKLHAPIAQAAAVVKASTQQDLARRFLAFLTGKAAAPIWKRYGYELPE
jgi:molybdate transport system substrate-binding protein